MNFIQKLGKAVLLPVAALPLCGILMGIGYLLCPASMQGAEVVGAGPTIGLFLVHAGGAVINNMALLFAVGVGVGMADEKNSTAAITSLVSWLLLTNLLSTDLVTKILPQISSQKTALLAFQHIDNPFIGILAGLIGAYSYSRFKNTQLPNWLGFFSGKRSSIIVSGLVSVCVAALLIVLWPLLFGLLVQLGKKISSMGAVGAGLYAFLNRLLLPFGLHHALNNVFWFDTIGLGDLTHFWKGDTSADVSWSLGIYMSGFFPCMMFGVPGAAVAIVQCSDKKQRRYVGGILLSAAICSFVCGITEPFEFSFMFVSPMLYVLYAVLYGLFSFIVAITGFRAGFAFSGGILDLVFSASLPAASHTWMIFPLGLAAFVSFYLLFRIAIPVFHLKTPGRGPENEDIKNQDSDETSDVASTSVTSDAGLEAGVSIPTLLDGLGGAENILVLDNCFTRLRLVLKDISLISKEKILSAGAKGVVRVGSNNLQVIIGLNVEAVADSLKKYIQ